MVKARIRLGRVVEGSLIGTFVLVGLIFLFYAFIFLASYLASHGFPYTDGFVIMIGRFALEPLWIDAVFFGFYVMGGIEAGWLSSKNVDRRLTSGFLSGLLVAFWFLVLRFVFSLGDAIVSGLFSGSLFTPLVGFFASALGNAPFMMVAFVISAVGTGAGGIFGSYLRWSPGIKFVIKK